MTSFGSLSRWATRAAAVLALLPVALVPLAAQSKGGTYRAPRAPDGKPDLQGIWEVRNNAESGLEAHSADEGIMPGTGVIVDPPDGKIPYLPGMREKQEANFKNRASADPVSKCFLAGVPRINYMHFPFEIFQTPKYIAMTYEYVHAYRTIYLTAKQQHPDDIDFWMGDSRGHWDGDTLVVDVGDNNDMTWLDASGDFHSASMNVIERYTRTGPNVITYEATITDPKTFSRPWTIRMPLYRHTEKNFQLLEYECYAYQEEAADAARHPKEGK
jgi:hypothetical protein